VEVAEPAPAAEDADTADATLERIVARRTEFLEAYQDRAYGRRYRALVETAHAAEQAVAAGSEAFTGAVARGYFKLLAYKDEYEVARLLTDRSFRNRLRDTFTGDFRVVHHLAPPILARRDATTGIAQKRAFGPWVVPLLRLIARLRGLRGTRLDPFGYSAERRLERDLIGAYEARVRALVGGLGRENLAVAAEIAALPLEMRGFGHVKAANVERTRAREAELVARFAAAARAAGGGQTRVA
jgi:indolepyruvate ferredoxin oxidoreductase